MQPSVSPLQPCLHPIYARLLCAGLRQRGFSEAQIVEGTGLDWAHLHADNRRLSFAQVQRLVRRALQLTDCPWLGLQIGCAIQVSAHGPVGYAAVACADLRSVLQVIERFSVLRLSSLRLTGYQEGDRYCLRADEEFDLGDVREHILATIAGTFLRLLEAVCGALPVGELRFTFPFAEPPWGAHYRELLGPGVEFSADCYSVSLPLAWLDRPSLSADPQAARIALRDCEHQLLDVREGGDWTTRVQLRLLACEGRYPTLEQLAEEFHLSERTLIRRLRDEGGSYQQLLDEVRQELACWLLLNTPLSVEAVAERLGYQDSSNFSRTFRRWLGMTPNAWRNGQLAVPAR
ncbi:helix-turn-helix domain-containing protein [Pseudomonas sp. R-28-1W-6]|uniref:AraC family transcriptional regulator n=1 Tax=Pseudomonas sp. R-28-1W-6 TaxID=2650101 RepID=UPI001366235C|nr:AraC family transcriptional regulator [Pseudomonas sp. R-28-1W-6]MWV11360.1 helix-turn-helix domain-containing protein [Pseudomonas sp. R-28-1W-6]